MISKCILCLLAASGFLFIYFPAFAAKNIGATAPFHFSTFNQTKTSDHLKPQFPLQSRSSTIALTSDDRYLVAVNRQNDSVSVIEVRDERGNDTERLVAEIPVGQEPRFVALTPNDKKAFVIVPERNIQTRTSLYRSGT